VPQKYNIFLYLQIVLYGAAGGIWSREHFFCERDKYQSRGVQHKNWNQ